jgi:heat-inducible transcriptional repressor
LFSPVTPVLAGKNSPLPLNYFQSLCKYCIILLRENKLAKNLVLYYIVELLDGFLIFSFIWRKKLTNLLTERELNILNLIIEYYSKYKIPVGSSLIANMYREKGKSLSSATIRNVMSKMEDKGVLEKTHCSSGRVPSKTGYCVYVDNLKKNYQSLKISSNLEKKLKCFIFKTPDTKTLLLKHLDFLSQETGLATILLLPDFFSLKLSRIEFVRLSAYKLLIILISTSGLYRQVVVRSEKSLTYEDMMSVANYINQNYYGLSLYDIQKLILQKMQVSLNEMDNVSKKLLLASYSCLQAIEEDESTDLIVKGMANLFDDDVRNISTLHKLVEGFEQKQRIIEIISGCLDSDVSVIIDDDFADNLSFVVSSYGLESGMKGAFGLVGPLSMDYKTVMATMKCLTENVIETIIKM